MDSVEKRTLIPDTPKNPSLHFIMTSSFAFNSKLTIEAKPELTMENNWQIEGE